MVNLSNIRERYFKMLVDNILPFWLEHGMDYINGGIYTGLDRDGSLLETDKSVWFQGRALWVFCTAYERIDRNPEYLRAADSIVKFLDSYCFDPDDGRMYFRVTKDGLPVIKRIRYFFSETFAIIGYAAYARVSGRAEYIDKALSLMEFVDKLRSTPGLLVPKFNQEIEPSIAFGGPMILLNVLSELRLSCPGKADWIQSRMKSLISEIETNFVKDDLKCVLEITAPDGSFMKDHYEGRIINPGHAIEGAWFLMNEATVSGDQHLMDLGLKILDWHWDIGWDSEYGGGIIQYRDALSLPLSEYHQDMKFWWPQCEAAIANLMAYSNTKQDKYIKRFLEVDKYISDRFVDHEYGEWFGYFHRDGTLATRIKGNMYKGPFHIPRMYIKCIEIIDEMEKHHSQLL